MDIHQDPRVVRGVEFVAPPGGIVTAWRNVAYMVGHWQLRGFGEWTVVERTTQDVIGRVGFNYPEGALDVELGWIIAPDRWGSGFATEAARAAVEWLWANTTVTRAISSIERDNPASVRIAEKLGARVDHIASREGREILVYAIYRATPEVL
jgi:RimJ/RimL family protein N-acetyltransferase